MISLKTSLRHLLGGNEPRLRSDIAKFSQTSRITAFFLGVRFVCSLGNQDRPNHFSPLLEVSPKPKQVIL